MNLLGQLVGLLGRGISPTQGLYLHRTTQHRKKRGHTSMPRAVFEPAIPMFERQKTERVLDRAATGTGMDLPPQQNSVSFLCPTPCFMPAHRKRLHLITQNKSRSSKYVVEPTFPTCFFCPKSKHTCGNTFLNCFKSYSSSRPQDYIM
jgi:hypothetical protein